MATGDILSVEVLAAGHLAKVVIEGFVDGGSYNFGLGATRDPSGAKIAFTVTSEGYTATGDTTTVTRTVYGVPHEFGLSSGGGYTAGPGCMRKAWVGSGDPVADETENAGNLEIIIALSDVIYDDDKNGGVGTSGVDVTVTIAADWYTDDGAGGSSSGNTAATGLTVTNSSTADYPKVVMQWDWYAGVCMRDKVTSAFKVGVRARHKYGIASVDIDCDGQTSANNEGEVVTSQTATQRATSGYYGECFLSGDFALTNFNNDELVDIRAQVYPVVGDADSVIDTNSFTTHAELGYGRNKMTIRVDKLDAVDNIAYVSTTGDDGTGDGSVGNPYATVQAAINNSFNGAYLVAGNHTGAIAGAAQLTNTHWFTIQPEPGQDETTVSYDFGGNENVDVDYLEFKDVTLRPEAASARFTGGNNDVLRFTNCTIDHNAQTPSANWTFQCPLAIWQDCDGDWIDDMFEETAANVQRALWDGCDWVAVSDGAAGTVNGTIACKCDGVAIGQASNTTADNSMFEFSTFMDVTANVLVFGWNDTAPTRGVWVVGCVFESTHGSTAQCTNFLDDIANENCGWLYNVGVGERNSFGYNSTGSVAVNGNNLRRMFNFYEVAGTKHDDFGTQNANRVGQWECMMSAGAVGEHQQLSEFTPQWMGLLTTAPDPPGVSPGLDPAFVDNAGSDEGSGLGNGDYRSTNSYAEVAYALQSYDPVVTIDLTGRTRPTGATRYRGPLLPVPNAPTLLAQT